MGRPLSPGGESHSVWSTGAWVLLGYLGHILKVTSPRGPEEI